MSTAITEVVIGAENDKRIVLNNSQIVRRLHIGNDWNVGSFYLLLNTVVPTLPPNMTAGNMPTAPFQFGFCSSVSNTPADAYRRHAWFFYDQGNGVYNSGTTCPYYTFNNNMRFARYQDDVITNISFLAATTARRVSADGTTARTILGIRMSKANTAQVSGAFTYRSSTTTDPSDVDYNDLMSIAEGTAPSGYTIGTLGFGGGPWAIDEATYGPLDSVFISSFTRTVNWEIAGAIFYRAS